MFILGVIPARGGSKGIKEKNIYPLNGRPMITYTLDAARQSKLDDFVITTDCPKIARFGKSIIRPPELATDEAPMAPTIQHAVSVYETTHGVCVDAVMVLQPTSPLRIAEDIDKSIELFTCGGNIDSLYSGYYMGIKHNDRAYDKHVEMPHFQRNGAIFIAKRELLDRGMLWSEIVLQFAMPKHRSIDIDDMEDLLIAESILKRGVIQ